jgi:pantetheine-phosphate adenylyltransferase
MNPPVTALYPGTFDPITLGHEDIVRRAARLFDRVVIAVAVAHHKKTLFTLDERLAITREALADLPQVSVEPFTGLVTAFAVAQGARVMVRGVRSVTDFDYEAQLAGMNRALVPAVDTIYLTPGSETQHISSTLVREISMLGGDASGFVSAPVLARLQARSAGG